jgi:hypothetical protein
VITLNGSNESIVFTISPKRRQISTFTVVTA